MLSCYKGRGAGCSMECWSDSVKYDDTKTWFSRPKQLKHYSIILRLRLTIRTFAFSNKTQFESDDYLAPFDILADADAMGCARGLNTCVPLCLCIVFFLFSFFSQLFSFSNRATAVNGWAVSDFNLEFACPSLPHLVILPSSVTSQMALVCDCFFLLLFWWHNYFSDFFFFFFFFFLVKSTYHIRNPAVHVSMGGYHRFHYGAPTEPVYWNQPRF